MDYRVFLLSRIKERYDQVHDTTRRSSAHPPPERHAPPRALELVSAQPAQVAPAAPHRVTTTVGDRGDVMSRSDEVDRPLRRIRTLAVEISQQRGRSERAGRQATDARAAVLAMAGAARRAAHGDFGAAA
jgi:hypothetical protein